MVPYVEECLFINEPFKVLCDEDCRGYVQVVKSKLKSRTMQLQGMTRILIRGWKPHKKLL